MPKKKFSKLYNTATPLQLQARAGPLPEKSVDQVVVFDGMAAFSQYITKETGDDARIGGLQQCCSRLKSEAKFRTY